MNRQTYREIESLHRLCQVDTVTHVDKFGLGLQPPHLSMVIRCNEGDIDKDKVKVVIRVQSLREVLLQSLFEFSLESDGLAIEGFETAKYQRNPETIYGPHGTIHLLGLQHRPRGSHRTQNETTSG